MIGEKGKVIYARGANITNDKAVVDYLNFLNFDAPEVVDDTRSPQAMIDEAVNAAKDADALQGKLDPLIGAQQALLKQDSAAPKAEASKS